MKQRVVTALCIIAAVLPPILLGGIWLDLLIGAFALVAVYEILNCQFKRVPWTLYGVLIASMFGLILVDWSLFSAILGLLLIVLFFYCVCFEEFSVDKISIVFVFMVLVALTIRSMLMIYDVFGPTTMIYVAVATYITDTGAYFCGRFLGKHKLNERISPKKTIEGSIGGWISGAVISFGYGLFFAPEVSMNLLIVSSLLMPIVGQLGDLAFSAIKRHDGIKDFGNIFPGHGGVLDRIDSLIFNLILFMCLYLLMMVI